MQPPRGLAPQSQVSEDDTVLVTVDLACHVSAPAYGSLVFAAPGQRGTAVLLKPDAKAAGRMKARVPAADLKPQVRPRTCAVSCFQLAQERCPGGGACTACEAWT